MITLDDIKIKVRRLTRSPSTSQLTDNQLEDYIDHFMINDFPAHIKLFSYRQTLTFYTTPYVDTYSTETNNQEDPLYNFKNKYVNVFQPVYIAGEESLYIQSRGEFFHLYPALYTMRRIGTGDGNQQQFTGTLDNVPVLRKHVIFSSVDGNDNAMILTDNPTGNKTGDILDNDGNVRGNINYVTGVYDITFPDPPAISKDVNSQVVPYKASRPTALLYFNNTFTLRPVPDDVYPVNVEVTVRPSELMNDQSNVELDQYYEYIAYGAARKIFEDRMDSDSLQFIMPLFKEQERLVLRRTIEQQSDQRVSTIYQGKGFGPYTHGWGNNRGYF